MNDDAGLAEEELLRAAADLESPRAALRCRIVQAAGRAREQRALRQHVLQGLSVCIIFCGIFFASSLGQESPGEVAFQISKPADPTSVSRKTAFFDLPSQPADPTLDVLFDEWDGVEKADQWRTSRSRALHGTLSREHRNLSPPGNAHRRHHPVPST